MNNARFFIMRSETQAIKARKLLASNGISASVYKSTSKEGCIYGITFPNHVYQAVVSLLNANGISFTVASSHK